MSRKVLVSMLLAGTLVAASVAGVVLYRSVNAAASTPVLPAPNDRGIGGPGRGFDDGGPKGGASDEELASALGITVDELQAAYKKANDAALAQAVTEGLITQAQADQLKTNGQAFPFDGRWMGWLKQQGIDYDTFLAEALGITTEKLQNARTQAFNTRLDQAVTDGKLTQDQAELMKGQHALSASESFKSAMQTAFEAAIKKAVSEGIITQAQAELILQAASQKGDGMGMGVPSMGEPFMGGDGHGHGGFGGGPGFGPDNGGQPSNPAPYAPATSPSSGG